MAVKQFYHDIDLLNVGQLVGARLQNVTSAQQSTLAGTLSVANKGLQIYNTELKRVFVYDGSAFVQQEVTIDGDIMFKGVIANPSAPALEMVVGYQYAVGANGTLAQAGVTFVPSAIVNAGDQVLVVSATEAYVINRNIDDARIDNIEAKNVEQDNRLTSVEGRATALEGRADANDIKNIEQDGRLTAVEGRATAIEAKNVEQDGRLDAVEAATVYTHFATVDLVAGVAKTVTHGIGLTNKDAFTIRTALGGSDISVDVDSVDANSITLTSLVNLTGVSVMIVGK